MTEPASPAARRTGQDLEVHKPNGLPRWWWMPLVVLGLLVTGWWMTHPGGLPVVASAPEAQSKVGNAVYVGVTRADSGAHGITVRSVDLGKLPDGVEAELLVCKGGAITVTSRPEPFCSRLVDAEGARAQLPGDQLILAVTAPTPGSVELDDVSISYRDGLQWGGQDLPDVTVTFVG